MTECWADTDLEDMDPYVREAVNEYRLRTIEGLACNEPTNHPSGLCSYHQALILPKEAIAA